MSLTKNSVNKIVYLMLIQVVAFDQQARTYLAICETLMKTA
jgi:hypothetical protein